ncbi:phosphoenolpyruvate--protein phosphotransferase [Telmatobacter bradus]|uniref:phosphoenolpyruvate--protein phosphotransferase n=1 Tax=Telmatobacter bradus TaxID=474953 RepID=UPI003B42851B
MVEIQTENVRMASQATSKEAAIVEVAALLEQNGFVAPGYAASMLQRETLANTYLGSGIAIPHGVPADREKIQKTGVAIVQVPGGVAWQAGEQAYLVVGIAARSDEHLALLGKLTGLLGNEARLQRLAATSDVEEIVAAFGADEAVQAGSATLSAAARTVDAVVGPAHGLHARPATVFATLARGFAAKITVTLAGRTADGTSMASLLQLGAAHGAVVRIAADGAEAAEAAEALRQLKEQMEAAEVEEMPKRVVRRHGWKPVRELATLAGVPLAPGLAIGRLRRLGVEQIETAAPTDNPTEEKRQLHQALLEARGELAELAEESKAHGATEAAQILAAQAEILRDEELLARIERRIDEVPSASWAWQQESERLAEKLANSENELIAGRATDVRDAAARVLRCLLKIDKKRWAEEDDEPQILLTEELTPSEAATLDTARVVGFCSARGSATSHVAILARSLKMPALSGIDVDAGELQDGDLVILDADAGMLYLNPSDADLESARKAQVLLADTDAAMHERRFAPAVTGDGVRIEVCANIGKVADVSKALASGGEGVGLLRTEFLFLDREDAPDEEEQYQSYRAMLEALDGLPLVLRTLDIGGDKPVPYLQQEKEENPFLGVRGIRLCLRHRDLFRTQLRAAFRAAAYGNLKIMFPMIASPEEMRAARDFAEEIRCEVGAEPVEIGTMIEVPAAVLMGEELAEVADFFSIGTNDLTQYVMAMDRGNTELAREASGFHPAVLRMIRKTVEAAEKHGRWVGVCGGLAGEPGGALVLAGLGVRELSVSVPSIPAVKDSLRNTTRVEAEALARRALGCADLNAVRALLADEGVNA